MRYTAISILLVTSIGFGGVVRAAPQGDVASADATALTRELAGIQRSLDEIHRVLGSLLRQQETIVLLRRIEIEEGRLAPLAEQLRRAREQAEDRREQVARLESMREELRNRTAELSRSGAEVNLEPMRNESEQIRLMIELEQEQLQLVELRVIDYENELDDGRKTVRELDEMLRERLEPAAP